MDVVEIGELELFAPHRGLRAAIFKDDRATRICIIDEHQSMNRAFVPASTMPIYACSNDFSPLRESPNKAPSSEQAVGNVWKARDI
jgi:hypothetical protein